MAERILDAPEQPAVLVADRRDLAGAELDRAPEHGVGVVDGGAPTPNQWRNNE